RRRFSASRGPTPARWHGLRCPSAASVDSRPRGDTLGPRPAVLSLGGAASPRFPPAPRSSRRRFSALRGPTPTRWHGLRCPSASSVDSRPRGDTLGPHPAPLSLGGAASPRFPPARPRRL